MSKIAEGLFQAFSQIEAVEKDKQNAFFKYKYATEGALLREVRSKLVDAGIMFLPSVKSVSPIDQWGNTTVLVEYTVMHKEGEIWPEKIVAVGVGNDLNAKGVGDKGTNKAMTSANRYFLMKLFQIHTGDEAEIGNYQEAEAKAEEARLKVEAQARAREQRGVSMGQGFSEPFQEPVPRNPQLAPKAAVSRTAPYKSAPKSNGVFLPNAATGNNREDGRRLPSQAERDTCDMLILNLPELETLRDVEAWKDRVRNIFDRLPNTCKRDIVRAVEKRQIEIDPSLGVVAGGQDGGDTGDVHQDR